MTPAQLRVLALRMGASIELFIRGRLKKPEIPEESEFADFLMETAAPGADPAQEREIARRLFWEFQLGMAGGWGKSHRSPDCFEQGDYK